MSAESVIIQCSESYSLIKTSVSEIISSEFKQRALYFLCDEATDATLVNQVLSSSFDVKVQIETFNEMKKLPERRRNSIIFLENFNSFLSLTAVLTDETFSFDGFFLIVCKEASASNANEMFRILWEKYIYNVDLLVYNETSVTLLTFMPFTNESCFDTKAKLINVFDVDKLKWTKETIFPRKLDNLYYCPIRIGTYEYANAVFPTKLENGSIQLQGSDIELLNGLSDTLKFRAEIHFVSETAGWGELYDNGSASGAHKLLLENETDATIGWGFLTYWKSFYISSTEEYFMVPLGFVIPSGREIEPIEKLLIPFTPTVWICILIVMFTAVLIVTFVVYRAKLWRDFIIGRDVKDPFMGILVALFGGSSNALPRRNFPRYLLMMFLLYCLVMRTLYQSGLFKFMQSNKKGSDVSSINEMIQEKYTIYSYAAYEVIWEELKFNKM